jgi:hypothetical protein
MVCWAKMVAMKKRGPVSVIKMPCVYHEKWFENIYWRERFKSTVEFLWLPSRWLFFLHPTESKTLNPI